MCEVYYIEQTKFLDSIKAPWFILDTTGPILGCAGNKRQLC
jgi:hypothetical protein